MWSMTLPYHCLSVLGLAILFQTWFSTFFVTEASGIFIYGSLSLTSHLLASSHLSHTSGFPTLLPDLMGKVRTQTHLDCPAYEILITLLRSKRRILK